MSTQWTICPICEFESMEKNCIKCQLCLKFVCLHCWAKFSEMTGDGGVCVGCLHKQLANINNTLRLLNP